MQKLKSPRALKLEKDKPPPPAREQAVRWLAQREYAGAELRQRLLKAGHDRDQVAETISWLTEHNLQSDERFTEMFVRSRTHQTYGPLRIRQELRHRGVNDTIIEAQLQTQDWLASVERAYGKRFGETPCSDVKEKARRYRFLTRRGFSHEQIQHALQKAGV